MEDAALRMRRFYKAAEPGADGGILLDGRPVRTPARAPLTLPSPALAKAVAGEWQRQGEQIDPRTMPLTGLANAAIDRVAPDPARFASSLAAYGESDLLCYRAEEPPSLVSRQAAEWDAILAWAASRYDVSFTVTSGIVHRPQPPETIRRLGEALASRNAFRLAALSPLVTISGSLLIALAVDEAALNTDAAFAAAMLDELWQAEQWGEDSLATQARENRRAEFAAAAQMLRLL